MTHDTYPGHDRRSRRLTADEVDEIAARFMERITQAAENIGYDITTPESRAEINKDHQWVRSWRTGSSSAKTAAMGVGVTSVFGGILWIIWYGLTHLVTAGK